MKITGSCLSRLSNSKPTTLNIHSLTSNEHRLYVKMRLNKVTHFIFYSCELPNIILQVKKSYRNRNSYSKISSDKKLLSQTLVPTVYFPWDCLQFIGLGFFFPSKASLSPWFWLGQNPQNILLGATNPSESSHSAQVLYRMAMGRMKPEDKNRIIESESGLG